MIVILGNSKKLFLLLVWITCVELRLAKCAWLRILMFLISLVIHLSLFCNDLHIFYFSNFTVCNIGFCSSTGTYSTCKFNCRWICIFWSWIRNNQWMYKTKDFNLFFAWSICKYYCDVNKWFLRKILFLWFFSWKK